MKKKILGLGAICLVIIVFFLLKWAMNTDEKPVLQPVTLRFGWIPDAHQAGFWVALDKGFYQEKGLDVMLLPGGLDSNPIREVLTEAADIGQAGGIEQVISAVSEGLPIKAIAAIHRDTPHALISLNRNPIGSEDQLTNKTIAVAHGDAAEVLLNAFVRKSGIDESKIKFVPFRFDLTPLMGGRVDAVTGFSTDQPATLESKGFHPIVLRYSSLGVSSYGYTLFCKDKTIQNKRDTVDSFVRASREGWQ
ncbi:MAG: ABC transporter substrate-binding protein, partial [Candidatus Omnitrophota bacterium]